MDSNRSDEAMQERTQGVDPPGVDSAVNMNDGHDAGISETASSPSQAGSSKMGNASATASVVMSGAASWFSRVGSTAREYAAVAGQQLDKAADSINSTVDEYAQKVGSAYEDRMAKQTAQACNERDLHRIEQETSMSVARQHQVLNSGEQLLAQCITLTGDIRSEIQYATKESPLGRESYGLMMLVNVMVPLLEHGLRPDWKSVLPAATVTTASAQWLQNAAHRARSGRPTAFDMLQAADSGWGSGEPHLLGLSELDLARITGDHRRVQAWLYASLNRGVLAQRLQTLASLRGLMDDWYFPWALLRQGEKLTDMLTELVLVESQEGLVNLPLDNLLPAGQGAAEPRALTSGWTQKMRDAFSELASKANNAVGSATDTVSEKVTKVAQRIPSPRLERTTSGVSALSHDELPDLSKDEESLDDPAKLDFGDMHVNDAYNEAYGDARPPPEEPGLRADADATGMALGGGTASNVAGAADSVPPGELAPQSPLADTAAAAAAGAAESDKAGAEGAAGGDAGAAAASLVGTQTAVAVDDVAGAPAGDADVGSAAGALDAGAAQG